MIIKKPRPWHTANIQPSEITPREVYEGRRKFLQGGAALALEGGFGLTALLATDKVSHAATNFSSLVKSPFSTAEEKTPYKDVTTYNNFSCDGRDDGHKSEWPLIGLQLFRRRKVHPSLLAPAAARVLSCGNVAKE